jgi:hypothetical protein
MALEQVMDESLTAPQTPEQDGGLVLPHNMQLLTFTERLYDSLVGCGKHEWGFPMTTPGQKYPRNFSSHQACTSCGRVRLYDFTKARPGAMFRFLVR